VRHAISAYDVGADRLYGHIKQHKGRLQFLEFRRYVRTLFPPEVHLHFVLDNFSSLKRATVREWAKANDGELVYTPHHASWPNRIEAQFRAQGVLYTRRHRAPRPRHPSPAHPPLHRAAQPQHPRRTPTRSRKQGKRCLTISGVEVLAAGEPIGIGRQVMPSMQTIAVSKRYSLPVIDCVLLKASLCLAVCR
jgi:transposase